MKFAVAKIKSIVAPFAGAWIEIVNKQAIFKIIQVAPFAGAWIEISVVNQGYSGNMSLPSRERGLKLV